MRIAEEQFAKIEYLMSVVICLFANQYNRILNYIFLIVKNI